MHATLGEAAMHMRCLIPHLECGRGIRTIGIVRIPSGLLSKLVCELIFLWICFKRVTLGSRWWSYFSGSGSVQWYVFGLHLVPFVCMEQSIRPLIVEMFRFVFWGDGNWNC